jgi:hypothetical protein
VANRDDFPQSVKTPLGQRAGYLCSNPDCRRPTAGPHSDPKKALITGEAAHICAAAIGGPRYDANQTPEQRKAITNAIWLCGDCNKKVDTDWKLWPAEKLHAMKEQHEKWIGAQGMIPSLPEVTLSTRTGLALIQKLSVVNAEMLNLLREQQLTIRNSSRVELHNLKMMLRLPEAVFTYGDPIKNAGTRLEAKPHLPPWTVETIQPGAAVRAPEQSWTPNHTLEIPKPSASETVIIPFYTMAFYRVGVTPDPAVPMTQVEDPDAILPQDHRLWWFPEGTYQFLLRGEYVTTDLFVPLRYSFRARTVTSLPCQASSEGWELLPTMLFPGVHLQG